MAGADVIDSVELVGGEALLIQNISKISLRLQLLDLLLHLIVHVANAGDDADDDRYQWRNLPEGFQRLVRDQAERVACYEDDRDHPHREDHREGVHAERPTLHAPPAVSGYDVIHISTSSAQCNQPGYGLKLYYIWLLLSIIIIQNKTALSHIAIKLQYCSVSQ